MTYDQWWKLRKDLYQIKLWLLHPSKAESIKLIDETLDKAIEKIDKLKPKEASDE